MGRFRLFLVLLVLLVVSSCAPEASLQTSQRALAAGYQIAWPTLAPGACSSATNGFGALASDHIDCTHEQLPAGVRSNCSMVADGAIMFRVCNLTTSSVAVGAREHMATVVGGARQVPAPAGTSTISWGVVGANSCRSSTTGFDAVATDVLDCTHEGFPAGVTSACIMVANGAVQYQVCNSTSGGIDLGSRQHRATLRPTSSVSFEGHYDVEVGHIDVTFSVVSYGARFVLSCAASGAVQGAATAEYPDFDSSVLGACTVGAGAQAIRFNMPQYTWGAWVNYANGPQQTFPLCRQGTWYSPPCVDR